jgi:CRP-like cAMP-binding protein
LLGEVALFTQSRRAATVTALEPSNVLLIPRQLFLKMLDSFPDSARKLRDIFAGRLTQSTRDISNLRAVLDAYERK